MLASLISWSFLLSPSPYIHPEYLVFISKENSTMQFTLHGARLLDASQDDFDTSITIGDAHIQSVGNDYELASRSIDASDMLVTPGFIETHTHGGGGYNLHTTNAEEIQNYLQWAPCTGVTSFLVTVVGTPGAMPEAQIETAVHAIRHAKS